MQHLRYIGVAALLVSACGENNRPLFDDASSASVTSTSAAGIGGSSSASTGAGGGTASSTSTGGPLACIPGQQIACPCPGGEEGAQACREDGSGFGPCLGCDTEGEGGSGATTGSGGDGGSGGAGGCEPAQNPCSIAANCGEIDRGCGVVAECPSCESSSEYLSCNPRTHRCACTLADDNREAIDKCKSFPDAKPYYCGGVHPFRGPIDCVANDTSPISNGEIVVCCHEE